jgi:predicted PurR-regulated permease PerM
VCRRLVHGFVHGVPWPGTRNRLRDVYQSLSSSGNGSERLGPYLIHLLDRTVELLSRYLPISAADLRTATVNQAQKGVAALLSMTAGIVGSLTALVADALAAFSILFFFFRDGKAILRRTAVLLPLHADQTRRLFTRVKDTLNATVYGTLTIAALQGVGAHQKTRFFDHAPVC